MYVSSGNESPDDVSCFAVIFVGMFVGCETNSLYNFFASEMLEVVVKSLGIDGSDDFVRSFRQHIHFQATVTTSPDQHPQNSKFPASQPNLVVQHDTDTIAEAAAMALPSHPMPLPQTRMTNATIDTVAR
jgi:hypothetical protein